MPAELLIPSDYHPLRKVIVQSPGNETTHTQLIAPELNRGGHASDIIGEQARAEHAGFVALLRERGINTRETSVLVNGAVAAARENGQLAQFLKKEFPHLQPFSKDLIYDDLIGASDRSFYPKKPRKPFQGQPLQWMYYTRDFAVTLPHGVALTKFDSNSRDKETAIARFMLQHNPDLSDVPIVFDAEKEGVQMQGGDMIVLNQDTLLMGTGNLSSKKAAIRLAQVTGMNVLSVAMPKGPYHDKEPQTNITPLNHLFLHLDTIFNLLDKKHALVIPYFMQTEFNDDHPFLDILKSLRQGKTTIAEKEHLKRLRDSIQELGDVSIIEAGSGKEERTGMKLVDYLEKDHGYSFAYAGGAPKTTRPEQIQHLIEVVFPEVRFQATNVVATKPGEVLMYQANTAETQKALKEQGVQVTVFDGRELARWNGGPHCMTMPLQRG